MASDIPSVDDKLLKRATEWFVRLQADGCDDGERRKFQLWLDRSESHRQAYAEAEQLWGRLSNLKTLARPELEAIRPTDERRGGTRRSVTLVLLAIVVGGGLWFEDRNAPTLQYATAVGERRTIVLSDGSHLELNARTRLNARISWLRRHVELQEGEVLFTVDHQPWRPFIATVSGSEISDIGTVFDLRKRGAETSVAVLEGEVEIRDGRGARQRVQAGFRSRRGADGDWLTPQPFNADQVSAWTHGQLHFEHAALADVAAELSHHHPIRFRFADPGLAKETLSGTFDAADLVPFLRAMEKILPMHVERKPGEVILSRINGKN